ncbi:MAG: hypothetical protein AAGM67_04405, partial [Bacteroidota bacterium]
MAFHAQRFQELAAKSLGALEDEYAQFLIPLVAQQLDLPKGEYQFSVNQDGQIILTPVAPPKKEEAPKREESPKTVMQVMTDQVI